ncbi:MAG: hypothetical protein E7612_04410 [Ruminococcaceae bacterium]|nr:hypothetical protein [Oscillospiraceae bacterium]
MLDISRSRCPKLSYLKSLVDMMSALKYNQLQLYVEDFVFEYKNFPEVCKKDKVFSKEDMQQLDAYCKQRFIELVPNQNSLGHMGQWTGRWSDFGRFTHLAITDSDGTISSTLNPLLPESLELMDKIYDGYLDSFSSDKANLGLDEPFHIGINETKDACDKYGVGHVFADYLKKICNLVKTKYKKTPMFWSDFIFRHPEQIVNVPEGSIFMDWCYETENLFERHAMKLRELGLRFYVCPGSSMWQSFTGRTNNAMVNITQAAEIAYTYGAEGFLLTEWGDFGHPQSPSTSYPPFVMGAAFSWNPLDCKAGPRSLVIEDCKRYLDKFIYKTEGDTSLANIVFRMGNYYLLENRIVGNGTELSKYMSRLHELTEQKAKVYYTVRHYMEGLRDELCEVKVEEVTLREIKLNCDMVILLTRIYTGEDRAELKAEADRIAEEFKTLWRIKFKDVGYDKFIERLYKLFA